MKTFLIVSLFAVILMLSVEAVNFKKDYCNNQEYVGNPGNKYPHLHCGKNFLTLSRTKKNHLNLQGRCNVVKRVLQDKDEYYGNAGDPNSITNVLVKYENDDCPVLYQ